MTTCPSGVHYMHLVDHARAHIEETYRRPLDRPRDARRARARCCPIRPGSARRSLPAWLPGRLAALFPAARRARKAVPVGSGCRLAAPAGAMLGSRPRACRAARPSGPGVFPPEGAAQGPRRAAAGLRAARARAVDQRGGDPPAHAPRHRGRAGGGRGMLRLAGASHGARGAGARAGARQHRCVDARDRKRRARCNHNHGVGMRDNHQGLRLHAAQRSGLCREGRARVGAGAGHLRVSRARSTSARRRGQAASKVAYQSACSLQHGQKITSSPRSCWPAPGFAVQRHRRGASVLRLGRHLQHHAARHRDAAARPQGREHRGDRRRRDRDRQYRLHDPARAGDRTFRSCTRSSFSTGRTADRVPDALKHVRDGANNSRRIEIAT